TGAEGRCSGPDHALADAHRPRVGVLVLDGATGRDAAGAGTGAVHQIELDRDQLLGAREPVHLHERGGRPRVAKIAGQGPRGRVADLAVGHVDAADQDVTDVPAGRATAPISEV